MGFSDLYTSGQKKRDLGHFANIVRIAKANGVIDENEQWLIDKVAKKLNIGTEKYDEILKNPENYPLNPPASLDKRIERLYNLTKMILIDNSIEKTELSLLKKLSVGLGFPIPDIDKICDEAIYLIMREKDLDGFVDGIKKVA